MVRSPPNIWCHAVDIRRSDKVYGSRIIRIGPTCIKYYRPHKRLPDIPAIDRLEREIIGGKLLHSKQIIVARPWIWNKKRLCTIRRWYRGIHPSIDHQIRERDIFAFAKWLSEHRGKGKLLPFKTHRNLAILTHLSMLGIRTIDDPVIKTILEGKDLLHADLVPENILLGNSNPVVLDPESISVGHLAWDIAQLIFFIISFGENDFRAENFLKVIDLDRSERELVWHVVSFFAKNRN